MSTEKEAKHPDVKVADSLGQENPASDMERANIDKQRKIQEAKDKAEAKVEKQETTAAAPYPKQVDYDEMTVAELKELAHKKGVDLEWDMRKDEIIEALKKHH